MYKQVFELVIVSIPFGINFLIASTSVFNLIDEQDEENPGNHQKFPDSGGAAAEYGGSAAEARSVREQVGVQHEPTKQLFLRK